MMNKTRRPLEAVEVSRNPEIAKNRQAATLIIEFSRIQMSFLDFLI